jgi:hypothetical protein
VPRPEQRGSSFGSPVGGNGKNRRGSTVFLGPEKEKRPFDDQEAQGCDAQRQPLPFGV